MLYQRVILASQRYITKNLWQFLSSILGVVLAVAIVSSMDLVIHSAKKSFELSTQTVVGKTTHHVISAKDYFDESFYRQFKSLNPQIKSTPVLEALLTHQNHSLKVLGLDLFSERDFRPFLNKFQSKTGTSFDVNYYINSLEAFICSSQTAQELGINVGEQLLLDVDGAKVALKLYATIDSNEENDSSLQNLLIMDISTAQFLLDKKSKISRIDVIKTAKQSIENLADIDASLSITSSQSNSKSVFQMTKSFNTNLAALSLLAMLVAIFLIYNTMSFSVLRRKEIIGILRCLGLSKINIFSLIIFEAFILGIVSTVLGLILGYFLSKLLLGLVVQTINDFYFVLELKKVAWDSASLIKGFWVGVIASLVSSLLPALEAMGYSPITLTRTHSLEKSFEDKSSKFALIGLGLIASAASIFYFSEKSIVLSFAGLFTMVIGFAFQIPVMLQFLVGPFASLVSKFCGEKSKIAIKSISNNLSRSSVAVAALTVALSLFLSLGITVKSFRNTVSDWLNSSLQADVYISSPKLISNTSTENLNNRLVKVIKGFDKANTADISEYQEIKTSTKQGSIKLASVRLNKQIQDSFKFIQQVDNVWDKFDNESSILVSQPLAYKKSIKLNQELQIMSPQGIKNFRVIGIYHDYSSDQGIAMINQDLYQDLWKDYQLCSVGLFLEDSVNASDYISFLQQELQSKGIEAKQYEIRSNVELKKHSLNIFDRTFRITEILKIIALLVAYIGILGALLALMIERCKELAILKAIGLTNKELSYSILTQTLSMSLFAWIFAVPLALAESWVMIYVINHRSFGWTINFELEPYVVFLALLVAIIAAVIAAIYPSFKLKTVSPAILLKDE